MKRKRFSEEQIIAILREHEAGVATADLCRKHGMSSASFYAWKAKYGGMDVADAQKLKGLEAENATVLALQKETAVLKAALEAQRNDFEQQLASRAAGDKARDEQIAIMAKLLETRTAPAVAAVSGQ